MGWGSAAPRLSCHAMAMHSHEAKARDEVSLTPMYYRSRGMTEARAEHLNERVADLRRGGLSYAALSLVLATYENMLVTEEEARSWCYRLDLPKNPNKARARVAA
jgi:hypothetical protein